MRIVSPPISWIYRHKKKEKKNSLSTYWMNTMHFCLFVYSRSEKGKDKMADMRDNNKETTFNMKNELWNWILITATLDQKGSLTDLGKLSGHSLWNRDQLENCTASSQWLWRCWVFQEPFVVGGKHFGIHWVWYWRSMVSGQMGGLKYDGGVKQRCNEGTSRS